MLDLKLIRNETEFVREALHRRGAHAEAALDKLLEMDRARRELLVAVEEKRGSRNVASEEIAKAKRAKEDATAQIEAMRLVGDEIKALDAQLKDIEAQLEEELLQVPNLPEPSAPTGGEEDSLVMHHMGVPRAFAFPPKDHLDLALPYDMIDMERGARTSGSRFAYLKGDLVFLQFALVQFALQKLASKGFRPVVVPVLVRDEAMFGTGFFPTDMQQVYRVEEDGLNLVGTSEVPLAALHMDEILDEADLPVRYVGYSSCFRREAGAAGKDTRGIFRVHQFDKVEMFLYVRPESSAASHEEILAIEEDLVQGLGLAYRVVVTAAGDLGPSAAKKYDIEAWIPSQDRYREITSCSNTTDYQARRLNVRFRDENGTLRFPHTLNGTAMTARFLVALLETYQDESGGVTVPEVLHGYGAPRTV